MIWNYCSFSNLCSTLTFVEFIHIGRQNGLLQVGFPFCCYDKNNEISKVHHDRFSAIIVLYTTALLEIDIIHLIRRRVGEGWWA